MTTREDILRAAALQIVRNGFAASSLSAIAAELGLTKGALARQFPNKDDLAWGIVARLGEVVAEEHEAALGSYPHSGMRALARFLICIGDRAVQDPQVAAAVILFIDRASPTFRQGRSTTQWTGRMEAFLELARDQGELVADQDITELAEYIFITNLGQAVFWTRAGLSTDPRKQLRFLTLTLRVTGVNDPEGMIREVLAERAPGS